MSFLFKSKKQQAGSALPPATRNLRSADGPESQAPSLNGAVAAKVASPTTTPSINGSLNSLNGNVMPVKTSDERPPGGWPSEQERDIPSPEQKALRGMSNGEQMVSLATEGSRTARARIVMNRRNGSYMTVKSG